MTDQQFERAVQAIFAATTAAGVEAALREYVVPIPEGDLERRDLMETGLLRLHEMGGTLDGA